MFTSGAILVHLGALFYAAGLLVRDQLILRLLILTGTAFYGLYYYFGAASPLWPALAWSFVLAAANLSVIARIVIERTTLSMDLRERRLYAVFSSMSPGEFRRLLRVCAWLGPGAPIVLTREGETNQRLYYVLDGQAERDQG